MSVDDLTHFSLFSGIGGIDLASEWAGFKTIGQCEMNDYACKVLQKNFGNIPRWRDVRDVTKGSFRRECGKYTPTVLSGGFPCQPFSCAGKQRGKEDDRFLWPEMLRVVSELRPSWVIGENVAGFVNMALDDCLAELESVGYEARAFILPAASVGAWHKRDRCFIVAHSDGTRGAWKEHTETNRRGGNKFTAKTKILQSGKENGFSNTNYVHHKRGGLSIRIQPEHSNISSGSWWEIEPTVGRVANGVPHRVDRLRALGNAVVPQQVYPILKGIADIERGMIP